MSSIVYCDLKKAQLINIIESKKPDIIPGLAYYDFEQKEWRPCTMFEKLPYGLAIFTFDNEKYFITCRDSYRLSSSYKPKENVNDVPNTFVPTHDEMLIQFNNREEYCKVGKFIVVNDNNEEFVAKITEEIDDFVPQGEFIIKSDNLRIGTDCIFKESMRIVSSAPDEISHDNIPKAEESVAKEERYCSIM